MTDLAAITQKIASAVGENSGLGKRIKLDFGDDGKILIDAANVPNVVSNDDGPADTTVVVSLDNLIALKQGQLDPMMAFMSGKLKVLGDMGIAQKLIPLLKG
ncbi:SCP2 sterol-binding domain-containing protein [Asticcacaulis sp. BYS171W]|uniref:SCP2 sterol-binding domain-containing protein n=1 Tax=Asticcacaulis aquaticus TaxID=2984212 RepID=A0ABT5HPF0_9CAUL|nr:SCP2 sterol-binding domain-containing protein [Asticcacaulis aquaticus]MDC7681945.1 SCP2 sterol-binding domain-containing protein [Asticcacaulis aquaticus]